MNLSAGRRWRTQPGCLLFLISLVLSTIISLAAVEVSVRVFDLFLSERNAAASTAQQLPGTAQQLPGQAGTQRSIRTQLHPLRGFNVRPGERARFVTVHRQDIFFDGSPTPWVESSLNRNLFGYISPLEDYRETKDSDFVVGVFGGSVAAHFSLLVGDVFGEMLGKILPPTAGKVVLLNFGEGGYRQPQQLNALVEMALLGVSLDLIVNLDGLNEIASGTEDCLAGQHPVFPSRRHFRALATLLSGGNEKSLLLTAEIIREKKAAQDLLRWSSSLPLIHRSALATAAVGSRILGHRQRAALLEQTLQTLDQADTDGAVAHLPLAREAGMDECLTLSAGLWERSSVLMAKLAETMGAQYIHLLQPNLHVDGSKPLTTRERELARSPDVRREWRDAIARGYPRLQQGGGRLARRGIHFVDLTQAFADENNDVYWDSCCHINYAGNVELARRMTEEIGGPDSLATTIRGYEAKRRAGEEDTSIHP